MEPPPFGDGNLAPCGSRGWPRRCFNGATAFRRWKWDFDPAGFDVCQKLQWSHHLSEMEIGTAGGPTPPRAWCFNGATAFRRWKYFSLETLQKVFNELQWSHHLSGMEIWLCRVNKFWKTMLQWSHHLSGMEISETPPDDTPEERASMEPPPFGDGNYLDHTYEQVYLLTLQWSHHLSGMEIRCHQGRPHGFILASMEPPPFGDGNSPTSWGWRRCWTGFNRATTFRGWKSPPRVRPPRCPGCFNGATTFRGWKSPVTAFKSDWYIRLQWSHHLSGMEILRPAPDHSLVHLLQWSHHLSGMEIAGDGDDAQEPALASMEPPPFGDGNFFSPRMQSSMTHWLQWSHHLSGMEISLPAAAWWHKVRASMEPPPFGDGNLRARRHVQHRRLASMEPPPFGDGNA